jgi:subtilisin-like proprotein convertase family protein
LVKRQTRNRNERQTRNQKPETRAACRVSRSGHIRRFCFLLSAFCFLLSGFVMASSLAAQELRLDFVRDSLTGTHRHYSQFIDGIEVVGGARIESDTIDGRRNRIDRLANRVPSLHVTALTAPATTPAGGEFVYLNVDGEARPAWRVITEERRLEPVARYYDPTTGALLRSEQLSFNAKARVFDPNPVAKLNDPSLQDQNDAASAVPDSAYTIVDLPDLASSGPLIGPNVEIAQLEPPVTIPVDVSQSLMFDRSQSGFEEVNAYFHLDRAQRYLQSLGYVGTRRVVAYAIQVDPHAANGTDNSYYLPGAVAGRGALYFGDGGTDDAEDSDIMLHEYGHAIQDWIAPGTFGGTNYSQSRALGEGFGDYWSFSSNYQQTVVSGRDPACIADWDARCWNDDPSQNCGYAPGSDCLRRVDGRKTMADFIISTASGTEHKNGEIWSSALRDIFLAVGRRATDTIVIESTFGVPPDPTYATMARRMLDVDRLLSGGANAAVICSAMTVRGILTASDCDMLPRGEWTQFQSPDHGIAIPDNNLTGIVSTLTIADGRSIDRIYVRIDVAHTARGDLRMTLVAPDGTQVLLKDASIDRTADIHATYGLDTQPQQSLDVLHGKAANGQWQLRISDLHPKDSGSLLSWSLLIQFAGDQRLTARPASTNQTLVIPAVAHAPGANGTNFVSDVRVFNRGTRSETAMMIFTPSGANGRFQFAAINVVVPPGQVVWFRDVVSDAFATIGTGQLALVGDIPDLVATSRMFTSASPGTYGQFIPARSITAASHSIIFVPQLQDTEDFRSNVGFAETLGLSGVVEVTLFDGATGKVVSTGLQPILPFGHTQFPVTGSALMTARIEVITGSASLLAYGSVIDNRTGDAIFIPAPVPPSSGEPFTVAPAIGAIGALGTRWMTDVFVTSTVDYNEFVDVVFIDQTGKSIPAGGLISPHRAFRIADLIGGLHKSEAFGTIQAIQTNHDGRLILTSRTYTAGNGGTFGQFVPFARSQVGLVPPARGDTAPLVPGGAPGELLQIEWSDAFRTNLGAINAGSSDALIRFTAYDAGGTLLGRTERTIGPLQAIQFPLQAITASPVTNGRVEVEMVSGTGVATAWASVIDNVTGDPIFVPVQ